MRIERVLEDFAGRWHVTKRIVAAGAGAGQPEARFEGHAEWSLCESGLAYAERGRLWIAESAPMEAERHYLWQPGLRVYFEDGRFFHTVPSMGGRAHHVCPPDDYVVDYTFHDWPVFQAVWHVRGPRKDYTMTTRYTR